MRCSIPAITVALLWALGCTGLDLVTFPVDEPSAFRDARVPRPPDAQQVHYAGEAGLDHAIVLQFVLPDPASVDAFAASLACTPRPMQPGDNAAFVDRRFDDAAAWWVPDAPADALFCGTFQQPGYVRDVRFDPLGDGTTRVQVSMFTL
jgi:hypothetical protein